MQHRHVSGSGLIPIAAILFILPAIAMSAETQGVSEKEANEIAIEAYIYFYPLVTMDITRRQVTNIEAGKMYGRGPMNTFSHMRAFPPAEFREIVRPNFDTLYSNGWLDLTAEPVIVSTPDTEGRHYLLPMMDMWTDVFAVVGKRTTGTKAGHFAVVGPGWKGDLPGGVHRIDSPTPYVWIIGRTQTNGTKDYEAVHKIQDGYKIIPLSQWGKEPKPVTAKIDPSVDMKTPPLHQVNNMKAAAYFKHTAELLKIHPPHITDQPIMAEMKRLGLEVGKSFDLEKADPVVRKALEEAPTKGLKLMNDRLTSIALIVNGWQMNTNTMGVYGNYYLKRAQVAMIGLGANLPEDAIYPINLGDSAGKPLIGADKYVLHFSKTELPPVNAFWSVTLYDKDGFPLVNNLNRFALGDRDELKFNADSSLDLHIQNENPGPGKESNWLPAPKEAFNLLMRLYSPRAPALDGRWAPPAVKRIE
ncbi:MAG: DUF1254 domain-containing protein [Deltaproteobacteria bacterium]|nr:DUF1254 domain-containing protein [Deltaproteobacteria bacterium]